MRRLILLLFLAIPIVELWLLISIGGVIGGLNTVLLVIGTALVGGFLARRQGFSIYVRIRNRMQSGEPIVAELFSAVALLFAGLMLLLPGIITDILGFLLLIPYVRGRIHYWLLGMMNNKPNHAHYHQDGVVDVDIDASPTRPQAQTIIRIDTTKEKE